MIPEVHACSGYLVITPKRAYRDNAGALPQYQGPITLDVLPEELGELPDSDQCVSIEVIGPGERSGQRALLSVERFNQLAADGDMHAILMNAVAAQEPHRPAQLRRRTHGRGTGDGQARGRRQVEWGLPHRGRISPEEAAWVREHLDEVQRLRSEREVPLLDPADPKTKSATACNVRRPPPRGNEPEGSAIDCPLAFEAQVGWQPSRSS